MPLPNFVLEIVMLCCFGSGEWHHRCNLNQKSQVMGFAAGAKRCSEKRALEEALKRGKHFFLSTLVDKNH
jgi:hypothetical protein